MLNPAHSLIHSISANKTFISLLTTPIVPWSLKICGNGTMKWLKVANVNVMLPTYH